MAAPFYDANRDGYVSPRDALAVIAELSTDGSGSAVGDAVGESRPSTFPAQESTEISLAGVATVSDEARSIVEPAAIDSIFRLPFTSFSFQNLRETQFFDEEYTEWIDENLEEILEDLVAGIIAEWGG